ncbi:MAG: hypothetical protein KC503_14630 [Myxococcales bacterium]|nr:hypothetical protein [Myxococcales bacterium]
MQSARPALAALAFVAVVLLVTACGDSGGNPSGPFPDSTVDSGGFFDTTTFPDLTLDSANPPLPDTFVWPEQGPRDSVVFGDTTVDGSVPQDTGTPSDGSGQLDGGPLTTVTAPFTLDFESSNGGGSGTRDWQWGTIAPFTPGGNCSTSAKPPAAAHSGSKAWGTVLNDCYTAIGNASASCTNADPKDDSILRFRITLPASMSSATLRWWEYRDYFLTFDWAEVRVDGAVAKQHCTGSADPNWTQNTLDLSAHIGKTITVAFHFMATTVVNYSGWYIDDVSVQ